MSEDDDVVRIRNRLREFRALARLTHEEVAARASCNVDTVRAYEECPERISLLPLHAISQALGISLGALLSDRDPEMCAIEALWCTLPTERRTLATKLLQALVQHDKSRA